MPSQTLMLGSVPGLASTKQHCGNLMTTGISPGNVKSFDGASWEVEISSKLASFGGSAFIFHFLAVK